MEARRKAISRPLPATARLPALLWPLQTVDPRPRRPRGCQSRPARPQHRPILWDNDRRPLATTRRVGDSTADPSSAKRPSPVTSVFCSPPWIRAWISAPLSKAQLTATHPIVVTGTGPPAATSMSLAKGSDQASIVRQSLSYLNKQLRIGERHLLS